jgi:hypothetical protein
LAPAAIAAQQDDYGPLGWSTADDVYFTLTGDQTFTGFVAPAPTSGTPRKKITNLDAADTLTIAHLSGSSSAGNLVRCPGATDIAVKPMESVELIYNFADSEWQVSAQTKVNIKEVFSTGLLYDANLGDFETLSQASNGSGRMTFSVPDDFVSLVSVAMVAIPAGTNAAANIDLTSDYGAVGEAFNNHSESDAAITFNLVTNTMTEMDVSSVFSSLAAGDKCGLFFNHQGIGITVHYLGVKLRYRS